MSVIERIEKGEKVEILEIYEDEEVRRLMEIQKQLEKELKAIKKTLKTIDEYVIRKMKENKTEIIEDGNIKITLVSYQKSSLNKDKLGEFLSMYGKSLEEFEDRKNVEYIKKKLK